MFLIILSLRYYCLQLDCSHSIAEYFVWYSKAFNCFVQRNVKRRYVVKYDSAHTHSYPTNSIQFQNLPDFIFTSINMDPVHHKKQLQMKAYYRYICK
ncbi:hypothetical protein T4B_2023 [Trichinella pseudospiralis]|uniref:Uncharacterized protein n=1 Tax=Trichinella pseudospiralis TaxID=6337 RepID=A0A0V1GSJ6_TRIPS|nr:hypothetical protein T4B_2023 [Trichinella pseudospiralis]